MITIGLFLFFTGTWAQISINIDNKERTWSDANGECNLLGSNESGLFSELSVKYQDQVPTGGKMYWIAAIKKSTIPFKFNGCKSIGKNNFKSMEVTERPVYDCSKFCTESQFALSSTHCVCTDTGEPESCDFKLFEGTKVDFYSKDNYLEYQKGSVRSKQVDGTGDCAAVILIDGKISQLMHEFLPCDTKLPYLCKTSISGTEATLHRTERKWAEAVKSCDNSILKSSFEGVYSLSNSPSSTRRAWTGISRRSVKQWSNGNITDPYDCLAVSKNSTDNIVEIHVKNCSDLLPSLCERSDSTFVSSTPLTTTEGETTSFEVTIFSDVTTLVTTTVIPQNVTTVTSTEIPQNTSVTYPHVSSVLPAEQETTPNDNLIPPIVGGAVVGVIIILLIVLIVLHRRFQQKNINKVNRHSSGVAYSVVDKSRQESATGLDGALVQSGTDDTYDHTVNSTSRQSVHNEQENMYDHTTAPQKEPLEDNFYDSTCRNPQKETIINDNEYGSVNPAAGNDVYSHTNQVFSSGDTDVETYDSMKNLK